MISLRGYFEQSGMSGQSEHGQGFSALGFPSLGREGGFFAFFFDLAGVSFASAALSS
jgi:hypothetical protein